MTELESIRAIHTRLDHRITALETKHGENRHPACRDGLPAQRPAPSRAQRDHFPSVDAAPTPTLPTPPKPQPPPPSPPKTRPTLELHIGRIWLVRIGIVVLLTGFVFLGNYAYHQIVPALGPAAKLTLLALASAALAAIGHVVRRRKSLANYGRVLLGGGIAAAYYTSYAAHFVDPLRVITSPLLGGALLLASGGAILWLADRLKSQAIAAVTILLAFYTAAINPVTQFSLVSNVLLAAVGMILLLRNRWTALTLISLVGTYGAFAFWRIVNTGTLFAFEAPTNAVFATAIAFPACYWIVFTTAILLGRDRVFPVETKSIFLTLNNAAVCALAAPAIVGTHPDALGWATGAFGLVLVALGFISSPRAGATYLAQGLGFVTIGILLEFTGYQRALIFAFQSAMLLGLSRQRYGRLFQVFSGVAAVVATAVAADRLMANSQHSVLVGAVVASILLANAYLFKIQRQLLRCFSMQWRAGGFVTLATALVFAITVQTTTGDLRLASLLTLGLLAAFAARLVRLPELGLLGQALVLAGQATWFFQNAADPDRSLPLLLTLGSGAALIHWWQHQRSFDPHPLTRPSGQALHTLLPTAALLTWALQFDASPAQSILLAGIGTALLIYGFATRTWPITVASALFTALAVRATGSEIVLQTSWINVVTATILIGGQSLIVSGLGHRAPVSVAKLLLDFCRVIRAVTLILGAGTILAFVPTQWQFLLLTLTGLTIFVISIWTKRSEPRVQAAAIASLGLLTFLARIPSGSAEFLPNLLGFAMILVVQQLGRDSLKPQLQSALIVIGTLGIWLVVGVFVFDVAAGVMITASWSVLGGIFLSAGFALRERTYRHVGLGVLLVTLGRLVVFDVWQFDSLTRILSFITLGGILLAVGFFYNRFADTLRKWM